MYHQPSMIQVPLESGQAAVVPGSNATMAMVPRGHIHSTDTNSWKQARPLWHTDTLLLKLPITYLQEFDRWLEENGFPHQGETITPLVSGGTYPIKACCPHTQ